MREDIQNIIRDFCNRKGVEVLEGKVMTIVSMFFYEFIQSIQYQVSCRISEWEKRKNYIRMALNFKV